MSVQPSAGTLLPFPQGDIIDNVHHTFFTGRKWGACPSRDTDLRHWACCPGFSPAMRAAAAAHGGRAPQLGSCPFVFMRWKECFFLNDVPQVCRGEGGGGGGGRGVRNQPQLGSGPFVFVTLRDCGACLLGCSTQ